ncbi:MAG: hypothetical protein M0Q92_06280 [Methanoregula sp.]|jgi:hypothetical protein|nr:hypothetical protein [Methanoregula sp.]
MKKCNHIVVLIAMLILMNIPAVAGTTLCLNTSGCIPANNYTSIQSAINAASKSTIDPISVGPGLYDERIVINLSASSEPVKLNMSVSKEWVDAHGGISAIKAIRYSDDGNPMVVLETNYLFTAGVPAMCYFEIISPHGCSIFGIAAVSAVPVSAVQSVSYSPQDSYECYGADSDNSPSAAGSKVQKAPLEEPAAKTTGAIEPAASPAPQISRPAQLAPPESPPAEAESAPQAGANPVSGILNQVMGVILSNIVEIACGIVLAITLCASALWIDDQRRWKP